MGFQELVLEKSGDIKRALVQLKNITRKGNESFLKNPYYIGTGKYELIVSIEVAIAICNHINARLGDKPPETYADCFLKLANKKVITRDLGDKLSQMARFRNLLVHVYYKIDDEKVFQIIQEILLDLEEFIKQVNKN